MADGSMESVLTRAKSRAAPGAAARAAAARLLSQVRDRGQSLTRVLQRERLPESAADRALTQELVYGALRALPRLEALARLLLHRPLPSAERELQGLILIGLQQLTATRTPPHAAVAATVEASRLLGRANQAGLVNALLRRFLRERETLLAEVNQRPEVRWPLPPWLLDSLRRDWPEDWEALVEASDAHPPMCLRINRARISREDYGALLQAAGLTAQPIPACPAGLRLDRPCPTQALPGYAEGLVSVQDSGAQLAAELLDARPGMRVLDACAAPGGKTAAMLERAGGQLDLVALDQDAERLQAARDGLARLALNARLIAADAACPDPDWSTPPFARILLDAPCSATGVIRRHPDIKWLRRPEDIPALCAQQARLLDALWPLLEPGGRLLYATCSLLAAENQAQIAAFLARTPGARDCPLDLPEARHCAPGYQLLPSSGGSDGFYYALLEKAEQ